MPQYHYIHPGGDPFERTGEMREPKAGEYYLTSVGAVGLRAGGRPVSLGRRAIVRRVVDADAAGTVLDEARRRVDGEQGERYGPPTEYFRKCAEVYSVILGVDVTPEQVVQLDVAKKLVRWNEKPRHRDSIVDLAGYARVAELLAAADGTPLD